MCTPCAHCAYAMHMTFWGENRAILEGKSKDACPCISRHVEACRGMHTHVQACTHSAPGMSKHVRGCPGMSSVFFMCIKFLGGNQGDPVAKMHDQHVYAMSLTFWGENDSGEKV